MSIQALIVDDDIYNLKVLAGLLEVEGVAHIDVHNPLQVEGVLADGDPIDVVFLDLEMPHLNGYELFEILRAYLAASIPIVAYTVHTNEIDTARRLGFHSFLGKPLSAELFPDYLERILNGESVWEP